MKALQQPADRISMLWLMVIMFLVAIAFSAVFEIDAGVRAQGQVIPGSRTQVIQAVDGGMLVALHVHEGDAVKARQKLAELEPDRAQAGYVQSLAEVASKNIALLRTRAELKGTPPAYASEFKPWSSYTQAQLGIYWQRKRSLDAELSALDDSLRLANEELHINQRLYSSGDVSRSEVMRAERQVLDVQARVDAVRNKYLQDTHIEMARLEDDLSISRQKFEERQNQLSHTDLVSPMDGVVKLVRITTVGGVLKPGDELMQISPIDDELLVEIKINPMDVGQLITGLPVSIRLDALDSSVYGKLQGKLRYISPDTLNEQGGNGQVQTYYRALVAIQWQDLSSTGHPAIQQQDIKPGMTATADIITGKRTLLHYLIKPVARAFSGALLQR